MFTLLRRQTHAYCVKCTENLSDYGQKYCMNCGANLEKKESRTYDVNFIIKSRKKMEEKFIRSKL